jgi:hypothetical protein
MRQHMNEVQFRGGWQAPLEDALPADELDDIDDRMAADVTIAKILGDRRNTSYSQ